MQAHVHTLETQTHHATEAWRSNREQAYSEIYAHCAKGLGLSVAEKSLTERIAPSLDASHEPVIEQLRGILQQHCGDESTVLSPDVEKLVSCLMNYFLQVQAILSLACENQQHINSLMGRAEPEQAFDAADIDIHNLLQARETRKIPYLPDELQEVFGIRIAITQESIEIKGLKPLSC